MTHQQHYESFKNNADVLEYVRGALGKEPGLVNVELEAAGVDQEYATDEQLVIAEVAAKEHVLAVGMLAGSNQTHWKQDLQNIVRLIGRVNDGMALTNVGAEDMSHTSGSRSWQ